MRNFIVVAFWFIVLCGVIKLANMVAGTDWAILFALGVIAVTLLLLRKTT